MKFTGQPKSPLERVLSKLPNIEDIRDYQITEAQARECLKAGWTESDTLAYIKCFEEVDPTLSEDWALQRMKQIRAKYKGEVK